MLGVCFGEARELQPTVPPPDKPLFTGKERDVETGLDYFGARYQRAGVGRFTSVDPLMTIDENLADPQRWNRYAYVRDNPLRWVDPDGRQQKKAEQNENMSLSDKGLEFIAQYEGGVRLKVYKDSAGYDTIGAGHLILSFEKFDKGITLAEGASGRFFQQRNSVRQRRSSGREREQRVPVGEHV